MAKKRKASNKQLLGAAMSRRILLTCILISTALPAFADDSQHCSMATLRGTYGFAGTGTDWGVPYSTSGMESYDGEGNIKYTQLWHEGGITYTYNGTGKITSITANCVAKVVYDGDTSNVWTFFVAPDGSRSYYNNNKPGGQVVSGGHEDRMSYALLVN
jgi:hypothetical protein